jgi:hypothetical protein
MSRRLAVALASLCALVAVPAVAQMPTAQLDSARALLARYTDPIKAVHDGYLSTQACIDFPSGAMGVHFLNLNHIGPTVDIAKPQVLIYEPVGDSLRLIGAEWFVPAAAVATPPVLFGETFDGPMDGHQPIMPAELKHWDLHVWLWKDNPRGIFNVMHANVRCDGHPYRVTFHEVDASVRHH